MFLVNSNFKIKPYWRVYNTIYCYSEATYFLYRNFGGSPPLSEELTSCCLSCYDGR